MGNQPHVECPGPAPGFRFRLIPILRVYNGGMTVPSKKAWTDPAKRPASAETMSTPGDFRQFTETMRAMLKAKPEKKR